jgi:hypothetical protein
MLFHVESFKNGRNSVKRTEFKTRFLILEKDEKEFPKKENELEMDSPVSDP